MTDLAIYTPPRQTSLELAPAAWKLAEKIADTEFVPAALRNKPEAVLACILTGHELGIGPMQSLAKIHIIEGRSAVAAELMRALVLEHGHELNYDETTTTSVTVAGKRRGSDRWTRVTWTADDVKRGGLDQKTNHRKWPRAMLIARATAELCRMIFPDVLAGVSYAVEELEDTGTVNGSLVDFGPAEVAELGAPAAPPATKSARARQAVTRPAPADDPAPAPPPARGDVPLLPGEDDDEAENRPPQSPETPSTIPADTSTADDSDIIDPPEPTSPATVEEEADDWPSGLWEPGDFPPGAQTVEQGGRYTGPQLIAIRLANRFAITGPSAEARAQRIALTSALVGRPIDSSKDLTSTEIAELIARLDAMPEDVTVEAILAGGTGEPASPSTVPAEEPTTEASVAPSPPVSPANPADEVGARRQRATPPPEEWSSDKWREVLKDRKVKVTETMKEAHRLGGLLAPPVSIGTLDDVAGSGIAGDLLGFIEDLSLERKPK